METQLAEARDKQDFAKMGELEHVTIPEAKRKVEAAEAGVAKVLGPAGMQEARTSNVVTEEDVAVVLGEWTGIPVSEDAGEPSRRSCSRWSSGSARASWGRPRRCAPCRARCAAGGVGLRDPGKPIGSFLFLGPSGVGKTGAGQGARRVPLRRRAVDDRAST